MYILEFIVKQFKREPEKQIGFDPLTQVDEPEEESCEHIFMPVDSSGEVLACSNCGLLVNKEDLGKKNIFTNRVT